MDARLSEVRLAGLRVKAGGRPGPVLLLLHGLGATADVWDGVSALATQRWPGRWLAPDLPGHGGSDRLDSYTFAGMAGAVAAAVHADSPGSVTVLGHSLGGVLAFELASGRYPVRIVAAVGIGIKVSWTADELERAAALAERPAAVFPTRTDALDRHLRVSGLAGLLDADDPRLEPGVVRAGDGWQLALDPGTFAVGAPPMTELVTAAGCPLTLVAGERDHMVTLEQMQALLPAARVLGGLGHNAHVEDPAAVWALIGG